MTKVCHWIMPGRRGEGLKNPGRGAQRHEEPERAEHEVHERARDRRHHPCPPAGHEDVGDVHVERGHEAVQEREAELPHAPPVVDERQAVDELVHGDRADSRSLTTIIAQSRWPPEAGGDASALPQPHARGEARPREQRADHRGGRREEEEAAPAVEAAEEGLDSTAGDVDALEREQRRSRPCAPSRCWRLRARAWRSRDAGVECQQLGLLELAHERGMISKSNSPYLST